MTTLKSRSTAAPSDVDVRPFRGTLHEWFDAVDVAFGHRISTDDLPWYEEGTELDRALAAYTGDRVVGTAGIFSFELTIPGGRVPAAGVTMVGVHPTHRRRGVLTQMMRTQLEAIHDRGEPIAVLYASESVIYERFGYGVATFTARAEIERTRSAFRDTGHPRGTFRLVDPEDAIEAVAPVYDRYLPMRPGTISRSHGYWRAEFLYDPERWRRGGGPAWFLLHETDGVADAYAKYRLHADWDDRGPKGAIEVHEAIALTPQAERELWGYLLDIDLSASTRLRNLPVDTPLRFMLADPRRLGLTITDGVWLRIVDLQTALGRRTYAERDRLVFQVRDPFLPWNDGRWELEASQDGARIARTDMDADLVLDASELGATFLGGVRFSELALAGRIEELTPGAVGRADELFGTPIAPWCPGFF
jgi:predicted acetyltransferase